MAFSANGSSPSSEINVTPLIDVLLVLLIIFMVVVPQRPQGLNSAIPQGVSTASTLPPVTVQIVAQSARLPVLYRVGQQVLPLGALQATLQSMFSVRQDHTLIVQANRNLSYQQVATVVSLGRQAGASQISLHGLRTP